MCSRPMIARRAALAAATALLLVACAPRARPAASCDIPSSESPDVTGRANGLYGMKNGVLLDAPIFRYDALTRTEAGVDEASGKRWLRFEMRDDAARALQAFTADMEGKSVVAVVDGAVAAQHKVKAKIEGTTFQVSCCDPAVCERWLTHVPVASRRP